jgi:hypothetical protein
VLIGAATSLSIVPLGHGTVPVQGGHGAVFAITVLVVFIMPALTDCKEHHGIAVQGDGLSMIRVFKR